MNVLTIIGIAAFCSVAYAVGGVFETLMITYGDCKKDDKSGTLGCIFLGAMMMIIIAVACVLAVGLILWRLFFGRPLWTDGQRDPEKYTWDQHSPKRRGTTT